VPILTGARNPIVTNCLIVNITACNGADSSVSNESTPTMTNCTFAGNTALDIGGGLYCIESSLYVVEWSTDRMIWHEVPVGEIGSWTDPGALGVGSRKYYRIRLK